jgi:hypothetical protein
MGSSGRTRVLQHKALVRRRLHGVRKARGVRHDVRRFDSAAATLTEVGARPVRMYTAGHTPRPDLGVGTFEMAAKAMKGHSMFEGIPVTLAMEDAQRAVYTVEVLWAVAARRGAVGGTRVAVRILDEDGRAIECLDM